MNAGETQENANILGQIAGVLHTGLLARFGQGLSGITVRNIGEMAKDFSKTLKITNNDFDLTIKNPVENIENLRIYTYHEDANNTNSQGFKEGDLIVNIDGQDAGTLDKGNILRLKKGYKFNFNYEALKEKIDNEIDTSEEDTGESYNKVVPEIRTELRHTLEEADNNELIVTPDGSKNLGYIDNDTAQKAGITAAPIQANAGLINQHLKEDHIKGILNAGYPNIVTFLFDILQNYQRIYEGTGESLLLTKFLGKNHGLAAIELYKEDGDVYRAKTLYTIREKKLDKKNLLFSRSEPIDTSPVTDKTLQVNSNETGENTSTASLKSNVESISQHDTQSNGYAYTDQNGVVVAETQWFFGRAFINLVKSGNFAAVFECYRVYS